MAQDGGALLRTLVELETAVWVALVEGDAAADEGALDPAFLGVYPDGFSGKAEHVGQLSQGPTVESFEISEERLLSLGKDQALLAYRANYLRPGSKAEKAMFVSSIWRRDSAGWVNIFSQDTPALPSWDGP